MSLPPARFASTTGFRCPLNSDLIDRQSEFALALLGEGLRVREALEKGEALSFELEHAHIREMLLAAVDLDGHLAARLAGHVVVGVRAEGERHLVLPRVLEHLHRLRIACRRGVPRE